MVADHFRPQINKLDWHVKLGLALRTSGSERCEMACQSSLFIWGLKWSATVRLTMADHFEMDGIADYSIISGLQTTYIQRSTTALNHPICCICQCKFLNNRISRRKWYRLVNSRAIYCGITYCCIALCAVGPVRAVWPVAQGVCAIQLYWAQLLWLWPDASQGK